MEGFIASVHDELILLFARYSQVLPDTGLHPRPGHAEQLKQFFPDGTLDEQYKSTVYASRSGESVSELQARCDLVSVDESLTRIVRRA